jgi:hypothetical protein
MDAEARLEVIEQLFFTDRRQAMEKLSDFVDGATGKHRAPAMAALVRRVDHDHAGLSAYLALAGGALVEDGEESAALGRALVVPLVRTLTAAARMLDHVAHLPDAPASDENEDEHGDDHGHDHGHDGHGHDHEHDHDGDDDHEHEGDEARAMIGDKAVDRDTLDTIAAKDLVAVQAWFSLDVWYRPAVATWTRAPAILRELQQSGELRAALAKLGSTTETSHWLSLLVETVFDAGFVVVFPETGEAWTFVADGVVDMGQLSALMSDALHEPLARIGVTNIAGDDVLAVMRGEGPQQADGTYACSFHCYPVEAADPKTAMPRDDIHMWRAPGGTGTHSLPPDFLPGTLAAVEGKRVVLVVGPNSPGMRFVRVIPAVRTFDGLVARLSAPAQLSAADARYWTEVAKGRGV